MEFLLKLYEQTVLIRNNYLGSLSLIISTFGLRTHSLHIFAILVVGFFVAPNFSATGVGLLGLIFGLLLHSLASVSMELAKIYHLKDMLFTYSADTVVVGLFMLLLSQTTTAPIQILIIFMLLYIVVGMQRIIMVLRYSKSHHSALPRLSTIMIGTAPLKWFLLVGLMIYNGLSLNVLFTFYLVAIAFMVLFAAVEMVLFQGRTAQNAI